MIAALHIDNLLFLLLVAVAMLFRWLASVAAKSGKDSEDPNTRSTSIPPPIPRAPANSEEERIRKFLEALGQAPGSRPPPPVTRRPQTTLAREEPKRTFVPAVPKRQIATPPVVQKTSPPQAQDPVFELKEAPAPPPVMTTPAPVYLAATQPVIQPAEDKIDILALLRSPAGLRNAIILREIFGPPRSLQSFEQIGSA